MALLGIIRRWHIREQIPLREIVRRWGISRNTVRRYLRSETIEPAYAERRSTRAIDKYAFQLSALLKTEAAKSRKQRRTLKQIHEDLKEFGFEGSYDRGAAFARTWREGQSERGNPASKRTLRAQFQRRRLYAAAKRYHLRRHRRGHRIPDERDVDGIPNEAGAVAGRLDRAFEVLLQVVLQAEGSKDTGLRSRKLDACQQCSDVVPAAVLLGQRDQ